MLCDPRLSLKKWLLPRQLPLLVVQTSLGFIAVGAGLGMGLGGSWVEPAGQGKAASAALDGIARNPSSTNKMFVPLLLSLALMESLVIFTFLVTNGLAGTISKAMGF